MHLAFAERQFAQVVAVEIEQVEGHHHDVVGLVFSWFCNTEKSVVPSAAGTTISPSMMAEEAGIRKASPATFLKCRVQS
jgi:hypothetical protein